MARKLFNKQFSHWRVHRIARSYLKCSVFKCLLIPLLLGINLAACGTAYKKSSPAELANAGRGGEVVVLFRIKCMLDGQPYEPFSYKSVLYNVNFGLGSFETAGEPRPVINQFLSEVSRKEGWTYLVLPPGIYYLAVRPPKRYGDQKAYEQVLQEAPRWRIDVPKGARYLYAGTLSLTGSATPLSFGGRYMKSLRSDNARVENEVARASKILSGYFPGFDKLQTILMKRWKQGEPIIIRSPE